MKTLNVLRCLLVLVCLSPKAYPCSTFLLKNDSTYIIGANLDMPTSIPGYIAINKRGVYKESITWGEIANNEENSNPVTSWTSKYGSVTFTPMCREFPEGGINEKGLYIREMSLPGTKFPDDDSKPKTFMMQWMQYQLDNYKSVDEIISNINNIILDGWAWHFFACDSSGKSAAIEFLNGQAVIHSGSTMPYTVLCNSTYEKELERISDYEGFGGTKPIDFNNRSGDDRFVFATYMIENCTADSLNNPVNYGFQILNRALGNSGTQWSIVIDVMNAMIYFKTSVGKEIKYFSMHDFEYRSETKIHDINSTDSGNIKNKFIPYTTENSRNIVESGIEDLFGGVAQNVIYNTHQYVASTYGFVNTKEIPVHDALRFYPNPARDFIIVQSNRTLKESLNFSLINMNGEIITKGSAWLNEAIDLSPFDKGIYILKIQTTEEELYRKIVLN
jgi:penicillin V acylase-like amidase (Ntn superfamily)